MELSGFLQLVVAGILLGAQYALISIGMTLIFGVMRLFSFAHGGFFVLAAYLTFQGNMVMGLPFFLAAALTAVLMFGVGMLVDHVFIRPIRRRVGAVVVATLMLAFILQEGTKVVWGTDFHTFRPFLTGTASLWEVRFEYQRSVTFFISMAVIGGFHLYLKWSRFGRAMRMVAQDRDAAQLLGINVNRVYLVSFGLSAAFAGLAASFVTPLEVLYPAMGTEYLLIAMAVMLLAGLGRINGCIATGFIFGIIQNFTGYFLSPKLAIVSIFIVLILVLLCRPTGLFRGEVLGV
ncbi:MAG: branched-chain amino acid ABC transporter permease [Candidatus Tectomicrobia bacterium]|nr:branched-chain amino acid ABC transporter permease [Candidatus Tectomicrobia bacterium]